MSQTDQTMERAQLDPQLALERIVPLHDAAGLLGVSIRVIKRRYADKIVWVSPRKPGMRVKHALLLAEPSK